MADMTKDQTEKLERQLTHLFCIEHSNLSGRDLQKVCRTVIEGYYDVNDCDELMSYQEALRRFGQTLVKDLQLTDTISNEIAQAFERYTTHADQS